MCSRCLEVALDSYLATNAGYVTYLYNLKWGADMLEMLEVCKEPK